VKKKNVMAYEIGGLGWPEFFCFVVLLSEFLVEMLQIGLGRFGENFRGPNGKWVERAIIFQCLAK
jgi:hypothetical protein